MWITGFGGKITLDNTLQSRLMLAYETRLPQVAAPPTNARTLTRHCMRARLLSLERPRHAHRARVLSERRVALALQLMKTLFQ